MKKLQSVNRSLTVLWVVVVLTPSLLLNVGVKVGVDGASVLVTNELKNSDALDYVSLTDHHDHHNQESGIRGERSGNELNATTWVVGGVTDCSQLPPGCSCGPDNRGGGRGFRVSSVVCACRDENEVVHLKEGSGSRSQYESLSWEVKKCSKVVIHQNFLSAIFNSEKKLRLLLKFSNVPNLVIHEAAFTVTDYGSFSHETTVEFNNCDIESVPPKAFPSYLSLLKFHNCRIGTLSSKFIQSLSINTISLVNSTILDVQPDAFYQRAMIISLLAQNSTFKVIQKDAVASGIQHLNWTDTTIDRLEEAGLSGLVANVYFARCTFSDVQSGGFSVKAWSSLTLVNNTFDKVSHRGIDLTQSETGEEAKLLGNNWNHVAKDFVVAGMREKVYAVVKNNTFLQRCACRSTFEFLLSLNESKSWFINQTLQSSRCPLEEKERNCFQNAVNRTREDDFIAYDELGLLCSDEIFMCTSEVNEMHVNPKLPNRLQLLAFFIGAFVLFMVVSLLLTLMVYMVRKQRPRKSSDNDSDLSGDIPRKEFVKSLNPDPYGHSNNSSHNHSSHPSSTGSTTTTGNQKMSKTPSMPSRLAFLEDVEMEDKGVQTLPTELSADIIEGLREKLSKPDSFWDAKQTIDHLYDLIHVRDQAGISSPPDVTCNDNNAGESMVESGSSSGCNGHNVSSTDSLKPLVTPRQKSKIVQPVVDSSNSSRSPNRRSMSTFAQLSPTKTVAVGVGPSPSHLSNSHIYSELSAVRRESRLLALSPTDAIPPPLPTSSPPQMLADYTEPRDFQTHIYAELLCAAAASNPDTYYGGRASSSHQKPTTNNTMNVSQAPISLSTSSSVIPNGGSSSSSQQNGNSVSKNLNDLNFDYNKTVNGCIGLPLLPPPNNNIPADPINIPTNKRPLPLVPPKPGGGSASINK